MSTLLGLTEYSLFTDHRLCPDPMTGVCIQCLFDTGSQPVRLHQHPKRSPLCADPERRFFYSFLKCTGMK